MKLPVQRGHAASFKAIKTQRLTQLSAKWVQHVRVSPPPDSPESHVLCGFFSVIDQRLLFPGCLAGMVEVWLQKLVDGMQGTVKATIKRAYRNVQEMALEEFIFNHPAQIALLGIQFQWTGDTQVGRRG